MIMAFYNYRGLELKKKKKKASHVFICLFFLFFFFPHWYSTDMYCFSGCKSENTNLDSQRAIGRVFQAEECADVFAMLYYAYKTNQLPAWPCSGTRLAILHPENASHVSIWVAARVLFIDVCIQSTSKIMCSCNVNCFRCKTCPYVINCR